VTHPLVKRAGELADGVLYPAAGSVDDSGEIPATHWQALA
jgi:hypothetical protein